MDRTVSHTPGSRRDAANLHSSDDVRFTFLDAAMKRHQYRQDSLIEILHKAQEIFGYLEIDLLHYVAHCLKLPMSHVYGVATFYHFFSLAPHGAHTCVICMGTACYVKGAAALLDAAIACAQIQPGQTTVDGQVSLQKARCIGACGIAPAIVIDTTIKGYQTPDSVSESVRTCFKQTST